MRPINWAASNKERQAYRIKRETLDRVLSDAANQLGASNKERQAYQTKRETLDRVLSDAANQLGASNKENAEHIRQLFLCQYIIDTFA